MLVTRCWLRGDMSVLVHGQGLRAHVLPHVYELTDSFHWLIALLTKPPFSLLKRFTIQAWHCTLYWGNIYGAVRWFDTWVISVCLMVKCGAWKTKCIQMHHVATLGVRWCGEWSEWRSVGLTTWFLKTTGAKGGGSRWGPWTRTWGPCTLNH